MKIVLILFLVLSLTLSASAGPWKNGGESKSVEQVIFGTHDWIVWKALLIANENGEFEWLRANQNYMFFGTEAPDVGLSKLPADFRAHVISDSDGKKYGDTARCHCVLYRNDGTALKTVAVDRIVQEFGKAKRAIKEKRWKYAAFYIGAMAHYAGDLTQFMHLMGKKSRWNGGLGENQDVHGYFKKAFEGRINFMNRTIVDLEPFIRVTSVSGDSPESIAFEIAKFTDESHGGQRDIDWLYLEAVKHYKDKIKKPELWDPEVLNQTGRNVNKGVNAIAKLIVLLSDED